MSRTKDVDMLLRRVPVDGSTVGNSALIKELGWETDKYWKVREQLLNGGIIERGRGKGGSIRRCEVNERPLRQARNGTEAPLYEPLKQVLEKEWVSEKGIEPSQILFEITAKQGKKRTGGTWTRPDITAVSIQSFQHLPGKYLDVWTFEVKPLEALDVTAVFEAASHASRATRSYALLQVPEGEKVKAADIIDRCGSEAARLRVGLITFSSPKDFSTWETIAEAPRLETPPESLNEFISHLSEDSKRRIGQWK